MAFVIISEEVDFRFKDVENISLYLCTKTLTFVSKIAIIHSIFI